MTTACCLELFADDELRARIWCICEELTEDNGYQADMWAAAWAWISSSKGDDIDRESLVYQLERWQKHVVHRWRKEPYGPLHFRLQTSPIDAGCLVRRERPAE
jgi:hypothetical protein